MGVDEVVVDEMGSRQSGMTPFVLQVVLTQVILSLTIWHKRENGESP